MRLVSFCLVLSILSFPSPATAENWARFRGPNGQGISAEKNLPIRWSATENVAWKTPIPGEGWSSPIVWEDRIFLTTATEEGTTCRVLCIERRTGQIAWNVKVATQVPGQKRKKNSYATPTPVTDGEHVYAVFASGVIVALDMDGNVVWKYNDVEFFSLHGLGASPILVDNQLIMPFDGSNGGADNQLGFKVPWDQAVIVALNKQTGEVNWEGRRGQSRLAHVTPIVLQTDGRSRLISCAGDAVQAFDLDTGSRLWTIYSQGEGVTPSPVIGRNLLYTASGFEAPTIRAIRWGGNGDVTQTHIAWEQKKGAPTQPSMLYVEPYLYAITDKGIVTCFDETTGNVVWQERIGGAHCASPLYADGHIYFLSEEGEATIVKPGRTFEVVARNSIPEQTYSSFAVSQGNLFLRTAESLYCLGDLD